MNVNRVVSASRRTDLVAHYPDLLTRKLADIGPEAIHTLVLWTKDPQNLLHHQGLRGAMGAVAQVFVHWTVTGLGGTFLEPNIPKPSAQMAILRDLAALLGSPLRIAWRYDPLITATRGPDTVSNVELGRFTALAAEFGRAGVTRVHTSFVSLYPKVMRRAARAGVQIRRYTPDERAAFLGELRAEALRLGLEVIACCEPGQPRGACIDGALLARLHPRGEPCSTRRARDQRPLCGCTESLDIGQYLRCPSGCLYCYGSPGNAVAAP